MAYSIALRCDIVPRVRASRSSSPSSSSLQYKALLLCADVMTVRISDDSALMLRASCWKRRRRSSSSQRGGQNLYCDVAIQPCISSAIHLSHSARANRGDDLVVTETCARANRHFFKAAIQFSITVGFADLGCPSGANSPRGAGGKGRLLPSASALFRKYRGTSLRPRTRRFKLNLRRFSHSTPSVRGPSFTKHDESSCLTSTTPLRSLT